MYSLNECYPWYIIGSAYIIYNIHCRVAIAESSISWVARAATAIFQRAKPTLLKFLPERGDNRTRR